MFPHTPENMKKHASDPDGRRQLYFIISLALSFVGAWVNAQGQWVKDFSYSRVVNLPLLSFNLTTSGVTWYLVGLFDDLLGTGMNVVGLILAKQYSNLDFPLLKRSYLFLVFLGAYLILDMFNFTIFLDYYYGSLPIALYGEMWNSVLYFLMLPLLFLCDLFVLISPRYDGGSSASIFRAQNMR
jgi:hypothetical protein